jgi:colanic acid biosynthesis glycosyl transferase WcaI
MKILIYGLNFLPEKTGIGKYTGEMALWLAEAGHEVRVITAPPYYPEWSVHGGYQNGYARDSRFPMVHRAPIWLPKRVTGLKRLVHLASFALSSFPLLCSAFRWRPDIVWLAAPTLFLCPGTLLLARAANARAWLHVQDFEVDAAFQLGLLRGKRIKGWVLACERWFMRRFERVSTISSRMIAKAAEKGIDLSRLILFPNWVDLSAIRPMPTSTYRAELGIAPEATVMLYSGNMGGKQGLEMLAEVALLLRHERKLIFVFCGDGPEKEDLVRRCGDLSSVHFLPLQPAARLNELLCLADIHLLPQRADAADLVMPSKLTGMLASGRPVIATAQAQTELHQLVGDRAQCGLVVPPADAEAMAQAILKLAGDEQSRMLMGANGRAFAVQELGHDAVLSRFEEELARCLEEKDAPVAGAEARARA